MVCSGLREYEVKKLRSSYSGNLERTIKCTPVLHFQQPDWLSAHQRLTVVSGLRPASSSGGGVADRTDADTFILHWHFGQRVTWAKPSPQCFNTLSEPPSSSRGALVLVLHSGHSGYTGSWHQKIHLPNLMLSAPDPGLSTSSISFLCSFLIISLGPRLAQSSASSLAEWPISIQCGTSLQSTYHPSISDSSTASPKYSSVLSLTHFSKAGGRHSERSSGRTVGPNGGPGGAYQPGVAGHEDLLELVHLSLLIPSWSEVEFQHLSSPLLMWVHIL